MLTELGHTGLDHIGKARILRELRLAKLLGDGIPVEGVLLLLFVPTSCKNGQPLFSSIDQEETGTNLARGASNAQTMPTH